MRDDPTVVALVERARRGDKAAWDGIVERYAPLVWSICRRFHLSDRDLEDVGQTVWLRLVEQLSWLREPAALPGWIATTTRRECLRAAQARLRRDQRETDADLQEKSDLLAVPIEDLVLVEERNRALREAFARLPEPCRQLLSMLMSDPPVPYAEISVRLGWSGTGGIGPRRARCLDKLRRSPELAAVLGAVPTGGGGTRS